MKHNKLLLALVALLLASILHSPCFIPAAAAQPTAFTYQGFLTELGAPANSANDFEFKLYNDPSAGVQQGTTVTFGDVGVTNGLFTVALDFTATPFTGQALWLDIAVRPGTSAGTYTNLLPRQPITSAPYAIKAANAMTVAMGTLSDPSFLGTTTTAPLQLQVSNTVGLRLEYPTAGSVPNLVGGFSGNSVGAGTEGTVIAGGGTSGGLENSIGINSDYSAIGGGLNNNIASNALYAVIPGGYLNAVGAGATNAFAAGRRAKANHQGAFVWADSQNADFASTANNQFLIRAAGGVAIGTNDPAGAMLRVAGSIKADSFLGMGSTLMLGTTDNQPLQLKVNNEVGLRLEYPTVGTVPNLVGGYSGNSVGAGTEGAVIAGGGSSGGLENSIGINSDYSAIGGGNNNNIAANSFNATIAGGRFNDIGVNADYSAIGGGFNNNVADNSFYATIAGGVNNGIGVYSSYSAIGGGQDNNIASNSIYATIAGGVNNDIGVNAAYSAIGGGNLNNIASNAWYAVIPGGRENAVGARATNAFAAGRRAKANHQGAFVWADSQNADFASTTNNQFLIRAAGGVAIGTNDPAGAMLRVAGSIKADSFLGMGSTLMLGTTDNQPVEIKLNNQRVFRIEDNGDGTSDEGTVPDGAPNVIAGSPVNTVGAGVVGATISGGGATNWSGLPRPNTVSADYSTIGGGSDNTVEAESVGSVISGGRANRIRNSSSYSTIGGGLSNTIETNASLATISGGSAHDIGFDADYSMIGGGQANDIGANAQYAAILGGRLNSVGAGASYAVAAGRRAKANHTGSFVWADSTNADFASTANNQFLIRASGGVGIGTNNPVARLHVGSAGSTPQLVLSQNDSVNAFTRLRLAVGGTNLWDIAAGGNNNVLNFFYGPASNDRMTLDASGNLFIDGTLNPPSDRNVKQDFTPVDTVAVLEKVAALPLQTWAYKHSATTRHLGPVAQDFKAAFGLGATDTSIATVDADGVALAAIQGLNQKTEDRSQKSEARIQKLETENVELKQRLNALEKLMKRLSVAQNGGGE